MARMIVQLLDFTRVRLGSGIPIEPRRVDLVSIVHEVVDELGEVHPKRTIRVDQKGHAWGMWDPDRLAQVFSNLIANALQHGNPEHAVDVRIDERVGDAVRVEVQNTGTIPAAVISRLFEPLAGAERSRENAQGLGLGLFISHEIVAAHDGSIEVRSDAASGTSFTVVLPRVARNKA